MIRRTTKTLIKQGDTYPPLRAVLMDDETPVALADIASVQILARRGAGRGRGPQAVVIDAPCSLGESPGEVVYDWQPGDTDEAGQLQVEFRVTWAEGGVQTFPSQGYLIVEVTEPVA